MSNDEIPYQAQLQVDQLRQERANAVAYGQEDRVAAVDKQLASLGVEQAAAETRAAAAEKAPDGDAHRTPPQNRSTRQEARSTKA